ncbi:MAG: methenyltetrahydromethanopterin cyclohydrolase [Planctomycetaceae bacterium]|nr:methenyltetrahydromethanopterin cyclohydrolase [Planctomycetaceae bacterium]
MSFLNRRADALADHAAALAADLRIDSHLVDGCRVLDFGVKQEGGLAAGLLLARMCMSDLANIQLNVADESIVLVPQVLVQTDHPVEACLMSQYAGWKIATDDYFAMGSGPMRALARKEELFDEFEAIDDDDAAIGILETADLPTASAIGLLRESLPSKVKLTLAVAPTASQAGNIQVVARSLETAMHKLHELKFPLQTVVSGTGTAPLPPVAKNDLQGIGRTNDAILYGATVNLWVRTDDDLIEEIGPQVPSSSSDAHGETFLSLFKAANHDFYALDPALFSPAVVIFHNLKTGRSFQFGHKLPALLRESFGLT